MKTKVFFLLLAMVATMGMASAQTAKAAKSSKVTKTSQTVKPASAKGTKKCFVDADKNGVCDKYENKTCKTGNGTGAEDCRGNKADKKQAEVSPANTNKKEVN
nr:hypothetical protein [uncultured Bacteroides sp.]